MAHGTNAGPLHDTLPLAQHSIGKCEANNLLRILPGGVKNPSHVYPGTTAELVPLGVTKGYAVVHCKNKGYGGFNAGAKSKVIFHDSKLITIENAAAARNGLVMWNIFPQQKCK